MIIPTHRTITKWKPIPNNHIFCWHFKAQNLCNIYHIKISQSLTLVTNNQYHMFCNMSSVPLFIINITFFSLTDTFSLHRDSHTAPHLWHKTDMDVAEVLRSHCELELSKCFNKWHPFNVSNGATKLIKTIPHEDGTLPMHACMYVCIQKPFIATHFSIYGQTQSNLLGQNYYTLSMVEHWISVMVSLYL